MRNSIIICFVFFLFSFIGKEEETFDEMAKKNGRGKAPFAKFENIETWKKEKKNFVILDTRDKKEFDISHIQNAVFVGYDNCDIKTIIKKYNANDIIVCYCAVGYRSAKIADQLINAKVKAKVYNLYGGIFYWVNKGHDVYDNAGKKTNRIHAYSQKWGKWLTKGDKVYE